MPTVDKTRYSTETWVDPDGGVAKASDTLTGSTSADVHSGLGKPSTNMSSSEYHHDGKPHRKREGGSEDQFGLTKEMKKARDEALAEKG
jgi:hypothetical protein